jgi:hypothetical protein
MNWKLLFKNIGKYLLSGLVCGIIGIVIFLLYFFIIWMPANAEKVGLAIIAIFPVMIILFSVIGFIFGLILGLIIYPIVKLFKK